MGAIERETAFTFEQKQLAWQKATPEDFSNDIEVLTNKGRVMTDLFLDGSLKFISDVHGVFVDFRKAASEYGELIRDSIYRGEGYPKGNRKRVLGAGGMGSIGANYHDTTRSLNKLNYEAKMLRCCDRVNLEAPRKRGRKILDEARENFKETGEKAAMFGHSLGSFQIMAAFAENPQEFTAYVDTVFLNESPVPGQLNRVLKAGSLFIKFEREDVDTGKSMSELRQAENAGDIRVIAIESSNDPMIRGRTLAGRESDHYIMDGSSHTGGAINPDFIKIMAYNLAGEEVDFRKAPRVHHSPVNTPAA